MIIDEITRDDVMMVLEHVAATCALKDDCVNCPYINGNLRSCALAHLPHRWELDQIGKEGDSD